jgi:acyl-ACP thioesterase
MRGLYPEIEFTEAPPDDRPFARTGKKFEDADIIGSYTIRSVDIDLGGHMNNVNYIRAMLGCFSTEELVQMDIHEIEMNYISQSYEGDNLQFRMQRTDSGTVIGAIGPEDKAVFTALIR